MATNRMKFGQSLELNAKLLEETFQGIILEFEFCGIHEHPWPCGKEIYSYLKKEVDNHKPAAIVLNFLHYQYTFGNELMDAILTPAINSEEKRIRPCVAIAEGATKNSIQSLIDESMIEKVLNIIVLEDKMDALEHIKNQLSNSKI